MQALFFGSSRQPLFGVYHEAEGPTPRDTGIVICPPLWHEYIRAHRPMRNLAVRLSAGGYHVFRFDYYGTGDSGGDALDGRVSQWLMDIDTAIEELKDTSGVSRVSLVGLRFGGTLATVVAQSPRKDLDRLVLWDPVLSGPSYLSMLENIGKDWLRSLPRRGDLKPSDPPEMFGYPFVDELRREIEAIDLGTLTRLAVRRVHVFDSSDHDDGERLCRVLEEHLVSHTHERVPDVAGWRDFRTVPLVLLAPAMLKAIAGELEAPS